MPKTGKTVLKVVKRPLTVRYRTPPVRGRTPPKDKDKDKDKDRPYRVIAREARRNPQKSLTTVFLPS